MDTQCQGNDTINNTNNDTPHPPCCMLLLLISLNSVARLGYFPFTEPGICTELFQHTQNRQLVDHEELIEFDKKCIGFESMTAPFYIKAKAKQSQHKHGLQAAASEWRPVDCQCFTYTLRNNRTTRAVAAIKQAFRT